MQVVVLFPRLFNAQLFDHVFLSARCWHMACKIQMPGNSACHVAKASWFSPPEPSIINTDPNKGNDAKKEHNVALPFQIMIHFDMPQLFNLHHTSLPHPHTLNPDHPLPPKKPKGPRDKKLTPSRHCTNTHHEFKGEKTAENIVCQPGGWNMRFHPLLYGKSGI